jgi:serine/threonine protein kinase
MKIADPNTYINIVNIKECITITNKNIIDFFITFNFSRKSQLDLLYYNQITLDIMIKDGLLEPFALTLISQIIQGVDFCHSAQVCLLNLNVTNIKIFTKNNIYNAVISDLSQMICIPKPTENPILISYTGITNIYSPPEIIKKEKFNGFIVDMWYIGVIFYIMLKGNKAWDNIIINNEYDLKLHQTMIIWKIYQMALYCYLLF